MADFPVSIILQLVNKLSGPARDAARGIEQINDELKHTSDEAAKATAGAKKVTDSFKDTGDAARKVTDSTRKVTEGLKDVTAEARKMDAALKQAYSRIGSGASLAGRGVMGLTSKFVALRAAAVAAATAVAAPAWKIGRDVEGFAGKMTKLMGAERARNSSFEMYNLAEWATNYEVGDFQSALLSGAKKNVIFNPEQLKTMANFATATGANDLPRVAEMIGDAATGKVIGLKDLGIIVEKVGKKKNQQFKFTAPGLDKPLFAGVKDQKAIIEAVIKAMNARGGNAEGDIADTVEGRMDALGDAMQRFWLDVAFDPKDKNKGLFPFLKTQLFELTDWLDKKQKDGTLGQWAQMVSDQVIKTVTSLSELAKSMPGMVKGLTDMAPALKDLDVGKIAMLAAGLYMLPDGIKIGAGLTQIGVGLIEIMAAMKDIPKAEAAGRLLGLALGIGAIALALSELEKYRESFRKLMEDLSGASIKDPQTGMISADYGAIAGQATRKWLEQFETMRRYYAFMDEQMGRNRRYDPTLGKMVGTESPGERIAQGFSSGLEAARGVLDVIKEIYGYFSGKTSWNELTLKIGVDAPAWLEYLFSPGAAANDLRKAIGIPNGPWEAPKSGDMGVYKPPAVAVPPSTTGAVVKKQSALQGYKPTPLMGDAGVYKPQTPVVTPKIETGGVTPFISSMEDARSLWNEAYRDKQAKVDSNVPAILNWLQTLKSMWMSDWGTKTLNIQQPSIRQPFGNNGLMPPRPPSQSGTMTDKVGWNRLPPGGSTTNSNNTTTVNVAVHVKGGADAATAERIASAAAAKVRTALRGGLYDGSVPQVI